MTRVFSNLRVVEVAQGMAGPLAGMILADNGAEVIKVESPAGDWARQSPGFLMWNRGKKSVVLDLEREAEREAAAQLAASADVVIAHFHAGDAQRLGLDYTALRRRNARLVYCELTGFGPATGHESLPPYEPLVLARSGRLNGNDNISGALFTGRPIYLTSPVASYGAAGLAVIGITAALRQRSRTGRGQQVHTSLLDGASAATMRLAFQREGDRVVLASKSGPSALMRRGIDLCFLTPKCKDGRYIQMCARTDHHFRNWFKTMELSHLLDDERFAKAPMGLKSFADAEELEAQIRAAMATRTAGEWIDIFTHQIDVGGDPFLLPAEFLAHPQMVENERIWKIADAAKGTVTQVGPLALFSETKSSATESAPALGRDQSLLSAIAKETVPTPAERGDNRKHDDATGKPPLAGVTVLELASFLAGPLGPTLLAELGARVIKIEPLEGDPFRRLGLEFAHLVQGKESLAVDLKNSLGTEVFKRAVLRADALVHNFRPDVPKRLNVDYESVHKLNPRMVYVYAASYGSKGPQSHRPAFHSTPHALSGGGIIQAGVGNQPIDDSYPDPVSGIGVGVALMLGLHARDRLGRGQYIETSMLSSSGYANSEWLTLYEGLQEMQPQDSQQQGFHALNRLYKTQDGWLMVCVRTEAEWARLASAIERADLLAEREFANAAERQRHSARLAAELVPLFGSRPCAHWDRLARSANLPLTSVGDSFEEFMVANGLAISENHSEYGSYWRLKPRVRLSDSPNKIGLPSALGEYTVKLLEEFEFGPKEIGQMIDQGVVRVK